MTSINYIPDEAKVTTVNSKKIQKNPCQPLKSVLGLLHQKGNERDSVSGAWQEFGITDWECRWSERDNREHSGADCSNSISRKEVLGEVGQYVARVKCKKRGRQRCLQGGWHRGYWLSVPEYHNMMFRDFLSQWQGKWTSCMHEEIFDHHRI